MDVTDVEVVSKSNILPNDIDRAAGIGGVGVDYARNQTGGVTGHLGSLEAQAVGDTSVNTIRNRGVSNSLQPLQLSKKRQHLPRIVVLRRVGLLSTEQRDSCYKLPFTSRTEYNGR